MIPLLQKLGLVALIAALAIGGTWSATVAAGLPAATDTVQSAGPVAGESCPWVMNIGGGGGGGGPGQEFLAPESVSSSAVLSRLIGHKDAITAAAYSPNGRLIATSDDIDVRLWDAVGGNQLFAFSDPKGVSSPQFSPDNRLIAARVNEQATWLTTGRGAEAAKLWNTQTGREVLNISDGYIVAFSPDSRTVAVAGDGTVRLYDVETGTRARVLSIAAPPISFSPDGKIVAAIAPSSDDLGSSWFHADAIVLWNATTGTRLRELAAEVRLAGESLALGEKGHVWVRSLVFSADGERLLSSGTDGAARLWDVKTGRHLRCFNTTADPDSKPTRINLLDSGPVSLVFKRKDALLAAAAVGPLIHVWNASTNRVETTLEIPFFAYQGASPMMTLAPGALQPGLLTWYSSSGSKVGRTTLVWNLSSPKPVGMLRQPGWLTAAALSPDVSRATLAHRYDIFDKTKTAVRGVGEAWVWDLKHADVTLAAAAGDFLLQGLTAAARKEPGSQALLRKAQALNPDPADPIDLAEAQQAFAEFLVAAGHTLAKAGESDQAVSKFELALSLNPSLDLVPMVEAREDYAEDLKDRADLLAQIGEYEAALATFRQARDLDPTLMIEPELDAGWQAARALVAQGDNLAETGDIAGAEEKFRQAQRIDPGLVVTAKDRALRVYDIARAQKLLVEGKEQAESGNLDKTNATYREAAAIDPWLKIEPYQDPAIIYRAALVQQGYELAQSGDTRAAAAKFTQAVSVDPTLKFEAADPTQEAVRVYAETFMAEGTRLARTGNLQGAVAKFRQALAIDPTLEIEPEQKARQDYASTLSGTGWALAEAGNVDSAIAAYQRALDLDPTLDIDPEQKAKGAYALVLKEEGTELAQNGDLNGAAGIFKRAIALDPTLSINPAQEARTQYAGGIKSAGDALAREGEIERAVARYSEALALNPALDIDPVAEAYRSYADGLSYPPRGLTWRADELARRGGIDRAVALYWEALAVNPTLDIDPELEAGEKYATALLQEADSLLRSGTDDAAAAIDLARVLENMPVAALATDPLKDLCWFGSLLSRDSRFLGACDEVVSRTPNDTGVRIRRAIARALTGDFAAAIEDFQYTIEQDASRADLANDIVVRRNWIQSLQSGRDATSIFTPQLLQTMRRWEWR